MMVRKQYYMTRDEMIHEENQKMKGRPMKIGSDYAYADCLERLMLGVQPNGKVDRRKRYSPAAALAMARREGYQTSVCVNTLYSYIDKGIFLNLTNKDLWEKGKKKQKKQKVRRTPHPLLPSITERPEHISLRTEAGHHEMNLIVGREGAKAATLTLTDRKKRTELSFKIADKRAATVRAVFDRLERRLGKRRFREMFKSITTDNGPEFLEYEELTKSIYGGKRFEVYYCHSYSAWEKGTIVVPVQDEPATAGEGGHQLDIGGVLQIPGIIEVLPLEAPELVAAHDMARCGLLRPLPHTS